MKTITLKHVGYVLKGLARQVDSDKYIDLPRSEILYPDSVPSESDIMHYIRRQEDIVEADITIRELYEENIERDFPFHAVYDGNSVFFQTVS